MILISGISYIHMKVLRLLSSYFHLYTHITERDTYTHCFIVIVIIIFQIFFASTLYALLLSPKSDRWMLADDGEEEVLIGQRTHVNKIKTKERRNARKKWQRKCVMIGEEEEEEAKIEDRHVCCHSNNSSNIDNYPAVAMDSLPIPHKSPFHSEVICEKPRLDGAPKQRITSRRRITSGCIM